MFDISSNLNISISFKMSEPPIYGNLEEMQIEDSPTYGNLEDFTNMYSDEDFEAAAARIDLPVLPPKPQKRASWFQKNSLETKDEITKESQTEKYKKPKIKVIRKKKEASSLSSSVEETIPLNPSSPNPSSSNPPLPKRTSSEIFKTHVFADIEKNAQPVKAKKSRTSIKCLFIVFITFILLSGVGVFAYFEYNEQIFEYGKQILCFIGYGTCSDEKENITFNQTTVREIEERSTTQFMLTKNQEKVECPRMVTISSNSSINPASGDALDSDWKQRLGMFELTKYDQNGFPIYAHQNDLLFHISGGWLVGNDTSRDFGWIANRDCAEKCPSNCRGGSNWMYWQGVTGGRGSWATDNTLSVDSISKI